MTDDIISENWRTPGLPLGNCYVSLGNKYAYFYAAQCVNENPELKAERNELKEFKEYSALYSEIKWVRKTINDSVEALARKLQARFPIIQVLCEPRIRLIDLKTSLSVCVLKIQPNNRKINEKKKHRVDRRQKYL